MGSGIGACGRLRPGGRVRVQGARSQWWVNGGPGPVLGLPTRVRRGSHLAKGVVVMPPAFVNMGAYVGKGTMVDSHALVGSCAQVGALCGVFEGVVVRERAVLAGGVVLTSSTVIHDREWRREVPASAACSCRPR